MLTCLSLIHILNYKLQEAKEQIELQVNQSEFKMKEVTKKLAMARKNLERAEENLDVYKRQRIDNSLVAMISVLFFSERGMTSPLFKTNIALELPGEIVVLATVRCSSW